jgi:hypothetical protein
VQARVRREVVWAGLTQWCAWATSAALAAGCGGAMPMLHPAHTQRSGQVSFGAGVSGEALVDAPRWETRGPPSPSAAEGAARLTPLTIAPGVAPIFGGRMGLPYDFEAGLSFSGRALRADIRHAFSTPKLALSIGLGASFVTARRPGQDDLEGTVNGGGADLPILVGYRSAGDLYSVWTGPRVGFEVLAGAVEQSPGGAVSEIDARHLHAGWVLGLRVGFRTIHAILSLDARYHFVDGSLRTRSSDPAPAPIDLRLHGFSLAPAAGVVLSF